MLTPDAVSQVRRAVRSALLAETGRAPRWRWESRVPDRDFLEAVARHRVPTLLATHAEALGLSGELAEMLAELDRRHRLDAMLHVREVTATLQALAPLPHLVLKGAALAVQTTGDATGRGPGDVDVLVSVDRLPEAVELLTAAGWEGRQGSTLDRESWAWRHQLAVGHELNLIGPLGVVDLHWRLEPTRDALPDFAELWGRREQVSIGPVTVSTLGRVDTFRHAVRHAARDDWGTLRSLVDIHRLARDPALWSTHPDRIARQSLSVVDAVLGLPAGVPAFRRTSAGLARALVAQSQQPHFTRFPGDAALRYARFSLTASHSPRDVAATLVHLALPPTRTATVRSRSTAGGIGRALLVRSRPSPAWRDVDRGGPR